ncbi:MAG: ribosome biogenesis/translation initiation ATPase RLI [Candidatus Thermoplasmatota archaeon]|nr:ribosome biogenesis/translation initiation ATPase RLI [Candidatus Thermoplasmatota archaeon]
MRIASLLYDRCQPRKCGKECFNFCPRVRAGDEIFSFDSKNKPIIDEALCVGCGICVHKCPFDAIKITNLPEELEDNLVHQFGPNGFRLFRIPYPQEGRVLGLLGSNGIGKTTILNILSGTMIPNFGKGILGDDDEGDEPEAFGSKHLEKDEKEEAPANWEDVKDRFSGTGLSEHFDNISNERLVSALKPQYVDSIPKAFKGKVSELLGRIDASRVKKITDYLEIDHILDRTLDKLSGGELQRVAIAATLLKEADFYFFDEPSSYLDIKQRLKISQMIKDLGDQTQVMVVEHDLAILDFLADNISLMYGQPGGFGVVTKPLTVKQSINTFLEGYMRVENVRFRDKPVEFLLHPPRTEWTGGELLRFPALEKSFPSFKFTSKGGTIHIGESVGCVGPNATGKTTFVKMLAGVEKPDKGSLDTHFDISYKPQYIRHDFDGAVRDYLIIELKEAFGTGFFKAEIEGPLSLKHLYDKEMCKLSGGEQQRVAVARALSVEADLYLLDEPSAYLDANQRMDVAKIIRRVIEKKGRSGFIVDHDVYFIDLVSDSLMVFQGEPSLNGHAVGPLELRSGMNLFLKDVGITFRRDMGTKRPRINKCGSRLDSEQKQKGEYYYA